MANCIRAANEGCPGLCRRNLRLAALLLLAAGCAGMPLEPDSADFRVEGKVGVVEAGRAYSARFQWRQTGPRYDIALWGPLGQGRTRLRGDKDHVEVIGKSGRPVLAGHPETVMRQRLGWSLPLAVLPWWISGQPVPGSVVEESERDGEGRLISFSQLGWRVRYTRFGAGGDPALPNAMTAARPGYRVRLTILSR